jgi:hypothetical protein
VKRYEITEKGTGNVIAAGARDEFNGHWTTMDPAYAVPTTGLQPTPGQALDFAAAQSGLDVADLSFDWTED